MRLSVTDLETLRYFKKSEDATLEKLLADLAHVGIPTAKMEAGKALAKFCEHAKPGELDSVTVDGWTINFEMDGELVLPHVRELKLEREFTTPSGPVTLVGKVDGLDGVTVHDQKLTEAFDVEGKYLDSLQWRAYLVMTGARKFTYDVFVGRIDEVDHMVTVRELHSFDFYAYPLMERDVERAVCELAEIETRYQAEIEALRSASKEGK